MSTETEIMTRFNLLSPQLDERSRRLYVAAEAKALGRGGVTILSRLTGLARSTIKRGQDELAIQESLKGNEERVSSENDKKRIRRPGGGSKRKEYYLPKWGEALDNLLDPLTRGDPESPLRWTIKSTKTLSVELSKLGYQVSPNTVMRQLHTMEYSLKSNMKVLEGKNHPDRNAQFEYINNKVKEYINSGNPVISVDTKKKEVLGNFKNDGQQWTAKGSATKVNDHDFPDPKLPRALPFGVYDITNNIGHVVVGTDHDTAEFATNSIYGWWKKYGELLYKDATSLLITADSGGSNGYRLHLWKYYLQKLSSKINLPISVSHFPPGTSKWNKIEHKLFSFISSNWRGEPLVDYETVVKLISATKTATGLTVTCVLDCSKYQIGRKLTKDEKATIKIERDLFHGEWNYTILP